MLDLIRPFQTVRNRLVFDGTIRSIIIDMRRDLRLIKLIKNFSDLIDQK